MLTSRDALLLVVTFASILAGVLMPHAAAIFQPLPVYCMMLVLFLSFLSIQLAALKVVVRKANLRVVALLLFKMLLLPSGLYWFFRVLSPAYATSALLLSGVSSGVVSPFFSQIMKANSPLVIMMVVVTSLMTPFTLPTLIQLLLGRAVHISLASMVQLLSMIIFIPLVLVHIFRKVAPGLVEPIVNKRFPISLVLFSVSNLGVFSKYADFFRHEPSVVLAAGAVAFSLATIYFFSGIALSWGRPIEDRVAFIISLGLMNNVLVIVFSSEFFGPVESTVAAIYTIPFFILIIPIRAYRNRRMRYTRESSNTT